MRLNAPPPFAVGNCETGSGYAVVKCRCSPAKPTKGTKRCQSCACTEVGLRLCSPMCRCCFSCGKGGPKHANAGEDDSVPRGRGEGGGDDTSEQGRVEERVPGVPEQGRLLRERLDNVSEPGDGDDMQSDDDDFDITGEDDVDNLPGIDKSEDTRTAYGRSLADVELYSFGEDQND